METRWSGWREGQGVDAENMETFLLRGPNCWMMLRVSSRTALLLLRCDFFSLRLFLPHRFVPAAQGQQLGVGTTLHDSAIVKEQNLICMDNRRQTMPALGLIPPRAAGLLRVSLTR